MDISPLLGLRLRTDRLELRLPKVEELPAFARVAEAGVHPRDEMPFEVAWTDGVGEPGFLDGFVAFHLGSRSAWSTDSWRLPLGVWARIGPIDAEPVGTQSLEAMGPGRIMTGSWLGQVFQGRGYGTEMREAVLELIFAGLGASVAVSGYADGNEQSRRVSEKLGYERTEERWVEPRGVPVRHTLVELSAARWAASTHSPVEIEGLEPCLPLFGLV